jgi:hypothetical protein
VVDVAEMDPARVHVRVAGSFDEFTAFAGDSLTDLGDGRLTVAGWLPCAHLD